MNLHGSIDSCAAGLWLVGLRAPNPALPLGSLKGEGTAAHVELGALGHLVEDCLWDIGAVCDGVELVQYQLMPGGLQALLWVPHRLDEGSPLDVLLEEWADSVNAQLPPEARREVERHAQPLLAPQARLRALRGETEAEKAIGYIHDAPRRAWLAASRGNLFRVQEGVAVCGQPMQAMGNTALLGCRLVAVHFRRRWQAAEARQHAVRLVAEAEGGGALVGAFVSQAERAVFDYAMAAHSPVVRLMPSGFRPGYRPAGDAFYACAEGRLLLLAPVQGGGNRLVLSRERCAKLNALAEEMAAQSCREQ